MHHVIGPSSNRRLYFPTIFSFHLTTMPPKDVSEAVKSLEERGDKYAAARQSTEAINMYSQAIGQSPSAELYLKRGKCYSILNKSDKAIKDFTFVIELDPLNVGVCF